MCIFRWGWVSMSGTHTRCPCIVAYYSTREAQPRADVYMYVCAFPHKISLSTIYNLYGFPQVLALNKSLKRKQQRIPCDCYVRCTWFLNFVQKKKSFMLCPNSVIKFPASPPPVYSPVTHSHSHTRKRILSHSLSLSLSLALALHAETRDRYMTRIYGSMHKHALLLFHFTSSRS